MGAGPLRLGMTPAEVAHALKEPATLVGGPYAQEDFAATGVSVFYDDTAKLGCVALGAATGPQTSLAGVPLGGRDPEEMERWLMEDYAAEHGSTVLFTVDGSIALTDLGLLVRSQQVSGTRLTRPLIVIEDWFESMHHREHLPLEEPRPNEEGPWGPDA